MDDDDENYRVRYATSYRPIRTPGVPYSLDTIKKGDEDALVTFINDKAVFENTLNLPKPYTEAHASRWIAINGNIFSSVGFPIHWAVRNGSGLLIGVISLLGSKPAASKRDELGYWLAAPYRGKGIMPWAIEQICRIAVERGVAVLEARTFLFNPASARVLEKTGFQKVRLIERAFEKDGQWLDCYLFEKPLK